eukprot:m.62941 g.62941  ORF g.62941 m.62941 type:complete len:381 (-) comp13941_c1_seq1:79-1221(-)
MEFGSTFAEARDKQKDAQNPQLPKRASIEAIASDSSDDEAFLHMAVTPMTASVASTTSYASSRKQTLSRPQRKRHYVPTPDHSSFKPTQTHKNQDVVDDDDDDYLAISQTPLAKVAKGSRHTRAIEELIASDDDDTMFHPPPSVTKTPYEAGSAAHTPASNMPATGNSLLSRLQISLHSLPSTAVVKGKVYDSGKKLKKIKRGGLAEQCQKLASYQRSEQNLYHHIRDQDLGNDRALRLEICSTTKSEGLLSAPCRVLAGHPDRMVQVVFAVHSDVSTLVPGTCFQIDAPWRELALEDGPRVILGPLFWHLREAPNSQEQDDAAVELACLLDEEPSQPASPIAHVKRLTTVVATRPSPHKQPPPGRVSPDPTMPKMQLFQ